MQVYRDLHHAEPPPCTLLAIRGQAFELGTPPGALAVANLEPALAWAMQWVRGAGLESPADDGDPVS